MSGRDGRPRKRKLSADEQALWSGVTRAIAPLRRRAGKPSDADPSKPPPDAPSPAPKPSAMPRAAPPRAEPRLEPLDRRAKKRLARGSEPLERRLDLHGMTQDDAHAALLRFLRNAQSDGVRFALVITGKGVRGADEWGARGVLRRQVPLWLKLPEFRGYVAGFETAHAAHGGEGALYVRLRRARRAR
jgi:DNA-nicking Smr family endonuclease